MDAGQQKHSETAGATQGRVRNDAARPGDDYCFLRGHDGYNRYFADKGGYPGHYRCQRHIYPDPDLPILCDVAKADLLQEQREEP